MIVHPSGGLEGSRGGIGIGPGPGAQAKGGSPTDCHPQERNNNEDLFAKERDQGTNCDVHSTPFGTPYGRPISIHIDRQRDVRQTLFFFFSRTSSCPFNGPCCGHTTGPSPLPLKVKKASLGLTGHYTVKGVARWWLDSVHRHLLPTTRGLLNFSFLPVVDPLWGIERVRGWGEWRQTQPPKDDRRILHP